MIAKTKAENGMIEKDHQPAAKKEKTKYAQQIQTTAMFSFDLAVFTGTFTFGDINVLGNEQLLGFIL